MTPSVAKIRLAELRQLGVALGDALTIIRSEGASLITSIAAVKEIESVSLADAKETVTQSSAWSEEYNQFIDPLIAELEDEP